ncbi:MAG: TolC family protein [Alphaproteobacteria bacterium]|nr:TolC family protein [Alphaproteobacteria bacterium]
MKRLFLGLIMLMPSVALASSDPLGTEDKVLKPMPLAQCNVDEMQTLSLSDVINLTLCRNPKSKQTYFAAMAAAADLGAAKSGYYPKLDFDADVNVRSTKVDSGNYDNSSTGRVGLSLNWLLYDFGARSANKKSTMYALDAAMRTHSDSLQDLIFEAASAYFKIFESRTEAKNAQETVVHAKEASNATYKRYQLGLSAFSDKLQADTTLAQAELKLTKAKEAEVVAMSNLAMLMDLHPTTVLKVKEPDSSIDISVIDPYEVLLESALKNRADIKASKAQVAQSKAILDQRKANDTATINLNAGTSAQDNFLRPPENKVYTSQAGINLNVPIFTGFNNTYKIRQAEHNVNRAVASLKTLENQVEKKLWETYQSYLTSEKSYQASLVMLTSATQNQNVAIGAYKAGRGDILSVLEANEKMADALTSKTNAYYDLIISKINLIRQAGRYDPFNESGNYLLAEKQAQQNVVIPEQIVETDQAYVAKETNQQETSEENNQTPQQEVGE